MNERVYWHADPVGGLVIRDNGVMLSFAAGQAALTAFNHVLSPVPMNPWPPFLAPLEEVIEERRQLHAALLRVQAETSPNRSRRAP